MQDKFLIARSMKKFLLSIDQMIVNLPRSERVMKDRFINDALDILELIYTTNYSDLEIRKDLQIKILGKIGMLDYYLERAYMNHYISERVCFEKSNELLNINKMVLSWIRESKS